MANFITLDQIDIMERARHFDNDAPLYVLVAGGMGAGKSHVMENNVNSLALLDIDKVMVKMGYLDYTDDQFAQAMEVMTDLFNMHMSNRSSIIAMGTASKVSTAIDRLYGAKVVGYKTILVHIDAPIKQAIIQNRHRLHSGNRGVSAADEYKIERTSIGAANTVSLLRETALVDYFIYYDNTRDLNKGVI